MDEAVPVVLNTVKETGIGVVNETKSLLHLNELGSFITRENAVKLITSLIVIIIFWISCHFIKKIVIRNCRGKIKDSTVSIISRGITYTFYVLTAMYVLGLFGINLGAVWGAAGIAGVAIGFAAQTSVSNLISGLFVLSEKTMKTGDYIEIDGVAGTVDAISILAVMIHTPDNQLVRIPNSSIINNKLKNYSTHKYRRYVAEFSVDYASDTDKVIECLEKVVTLCPSVINKKNYEPKIYFTGFEDSGLTVNLAVWCERQDFIKTRSDVVKAVVKVCSENNINIPFNRMDITLLNENISSEGTKI